MEDNNTKQEEAPERWQLRSDWLNENDFFIFASCIEQEGFDENPYQSRTISLIKIYPGYGYDLECFGVIDHWEQSGHPKYSDCHEDSLYIFDAEEQARKKFADIVEDYDILYPR